MAGLIRLYVDGGLFNGEEVPGWNGEATAPAAWAATGSFQVGRALAGLTGSEHYYWHGHVDEVGAHQRVLTETEVQFAFLRCRYGSC